jgi:hypothetical protein
MNRLKYQKLKVPSLQSLQLFLLLLLLLHSPLLIRMMNQTQTLQTHKEKRHDRLSRLLRDLLQGRMEATSHSCHRLRQLARRKVHCRCQSPPNKFPPCRKAMSHQHLRVSRARANPRVSIKPPKIDCEPSLGFFENVNLVFIVDFKQSSLISTVSILHQPTLEHMT